MTTKSRAYVSACILVTAILLIGCSQKNKEEISFTETDSSISKALDGWNYKIEPSDLAQICDDVLNSSKNMLKKIEDDINSKEKSDTPLSPREKRARSVTVYQTNWCQA